MSHFTQDIKKLQLLADYFSASGVVPKSVKEPQLYYGEPVECTLQKLEGNMNIFSEVFKGYYRRAPQIGESFDMTVRQNIDYKWFRTSLVREVEETDTGFKIHTLNSTYELKRI